MSDKEIESIYNAHIDDLYAYATHLGFEKYVIMDAIHDVFFKLCIDENILNSVSDIRCYLMISLKNRLIDIYKSNKIQVDINSISQNPNLPLKTKETIEDLIIDEEERKVIKEVIDEMLHSLSPRQREIIYLRYVKGLDYKEISHKMNITYASCRKLIHKAIKSLRKKYPSTFFFLFLI